MEASPSPLSSRAQPRDLQFCRPVLEMLFEEAVGALRPAGPTAKRQPSPEGLEHPSPNIVRALYARHTFTSTRISTPSEKHSQERSAELQIPRLRSG